MKLAAPREDFPARLLVVDDEPLIRESLKGILEDSGYVVELAACASEAVAMLAQRGFDLIITDYHMPGLHGGQLVGLVKVRTPSQRMMILTGAAEDLLASCSPPLADVVIRKPFRTPELLCTIDRLLRPLHAASSPAAAGEPK